MLRLQPIWLCLTLLSAVTAAESPSGFGFVKQYCIACHSAERSKGGLDLSRFTTAKQIAQEGRLWREVVDVVIAQDMPPRKHTRQPDQAARQAFGAWVDDMLDAAARANAGDPGAVPLRRLTTVELDHSLADLTGLDKRWTADLPADVSGGEGFTNAAASLRMSALFIEKQMAMAARIASHAELLPSGPLFHPFPLGELTRTQRSHWAVQRLDAWYRRYRGLGPLPGRMVTQKNTVSIMRDSDLLYSPMTLPVIRPTGDARSNVRPNKKGGHAKLTSAIRARADALWQDLQVVARTPRAKQLIVIQNYLLGKPYRAGSDPALESSFGRLGEDFRKAKLRDTGVGNAGGSKDDFRIGISDFTVGALLPYLQDVRPFSAVEQQSLQRFAEIYRSGRESFIKVPHAWAHAEFLHLYFSDEQLQALWDMLCDPESPFSKVYGCTVTDKMRAQWQSLRRQDVDVQQQGIALQRQNTLAWVQRAWRRPLTADERRVLLARYDQVYAVSGADAALRQIIIQTLSSPHFIFRIEPTAAGSASRELGPYELANRLSYFIWASPPDEALLQLAASGRLTDPKVMQQELHRMLRSIKIKRFAAEFFAQWLKFYQFDRHHKTDRQRFPEFTGRLRQAMYDEALVFCVDLLANDRPVTDLLLAKHAFLSPELARFYGVPVKTIPSQHKKPRKGRQRVEQRTPLQVYLAEYQRYAVSEYQRGGVMAWAAVLTKLSKPLRTSPIRRGTWVLVDVLGVSMPEPPDDVPEIPADERNAAGLSQRDIMRQHRQDPSCASCHARIDPIGVALESFDAIGKWRRQDLNGKPIDSTDIMHDGTRLEGLTGLRSYLAAAPQRDGFVAQACKMLLAYALGRSVQLSDEALLHRMQHALAANDYRISVALEQIITSRQFRHRRERDAQ